MPNINASSNKNSNEKSILSLKYISETIKKNKQLLFPTTLTHDYLSSSHKEFTNPVKLTKSSSTTQIKKSDNFLNRTSLFLPIERKKNQEKNKVNNILIQDKSLIRKIQINEHHINQLNIVMKHGGRKV